MLQALIALGVFSVMLGSFLGFPKTIESLITSSEMQEHRLDGQMYLISNIDCSITSEQMQSGCNNSEATARNTKLFDSLGNMIIAGEQTLFLGSKFQQTMLPFCSKAADYRYKFWLAVDDTNRTTLLDFQPKNTTLSFIGCYSVPLNVRPPACGSNPVVDFETDPLTETEWDWSSVRNQNYAIGGNTNSVYSSKFGISFSGKTSTPFLARGPNTVLGDSPKTSKYSSTMAKSNGSEYYCSGIDSMNAIRGPFSQRDGRYFIVPPAAIIEVANNKQIQTTALTIQYDQNKVKTWEASGIVRDLDNGEVLWVTALDSQNQVIGNSRYLSAVNLDPREACIRRRWTVHADPAGNAIDHIELKVMKENVGSKIGVGFDSIQVCSAMENGPEKY